MLLQTIRIQNQTINYIFYLYDVLTLKPLYHSLMVASSYLVCDFKKSMSSLDSLSLLPKQPMSATEQRTTVRIPFETD